jgi:hypothetical protein
MREKLRRALNEEKAGIHNDNSDIPLLVESEPGDVANFVVPEHVEIVSGSKKKKKGKKVTVEEDTDAGDTSVEQSTALTEVDIQPVETAATSAITVTVSQDTQTPVVIGGALKQTADGHSVELVKRKRKKKKVGSFSRGFYDDPFS